MNLYERIRENCRMVAEECSLRRSPADPLPGYIFCLARDLEALAREVEMMAGRRSIIDGALEYRAPWEKP